MQTPQIHTCLPAAVPWSRKLINHSLKLFQRLDCKDYCRFDWRLNSLNEPKMLEVNPNPAAGPGTGHLAKMSSIGGMDYTPNVGSHIECGRYPIQFHK